MNQITAKQSYINLSEAVRIWDGKGNRNVSAALFAIPMAPGVYSQVRENADLARRFLDGDRKSLAQALSAALLGMEDFSSERFLAHALSSRVSPRRSFVNLAEAIRISFTDPQATRIMLSALAGLPVSESILSDLVTVYADLMGEDREAIARGFAALLIGSPQFDVARFVHHATSDSAADEGGKWSYNHNNPEDAMKITIESEDESITS